jgi:DNA repair protein RadC
MTPRTITTYSPGPSAQAGALLYRAPITATAIQAGKLLDIDVLDHIILASDGTWTSLRQRGGAYWR